MTDDMMDKVARLTMTAEDYERSRQANEATRRELNHAIRSMSFARPRTQREVCQNINAYWYARLGGRR